MPTFQIKHGYKGICARCDTNDAVHEVFQEFSNPRPLSDIEKELGMEPMTGIKVHVCDDCK